MAGKKKVNAKEKREARKMELKEKYKSFIKKREPASIEDDTEDKFADENETSVKEVSQSENTDIESKDFCIPLFPIEAEHKQSKQDKKAGKSPKTITIGKYVDIEMRDRAFEAIKNEVSKTYDVKNAGTDNLCFIVSGVDSNFEEIRTKVYKTNIDMNVNLLERNKISRLFNIEV